MAGGQTDNVRVRAAAGVATYKRDVHRGRYASQLSIPSFISRYGGRSSTCVHSKGEG
jgi:hypothetical protein